MASGHGGPRTLEDWLTYIERVHPSEMALGLERMHSVRQRLALAPKFVIFTVGGTNGKGSCSALLEAMLLQAGYRTGCYTSPHLLRYNERVRVQGTDADDASLCRAFARIEAVRADVPLTYFEFGTLAAILVFEEAGIDAAVLEVGLGGRLDAVNAFDADCALVASIDLDHIEYLGVTRDAVGYEKAGIFRAQRPAICADGDPPRALIERAREVGARLSLIGRDFGYREAGERWQYWNTQGVTHTLPRPRLAGAHQLANAAACIAALEALPARVAATEQAIAQGVSRAWAPARFQVLAGPPQVVLDVAHNPHAARALAANLDALPPAGATIAVFSMLKDKDAAGVAAALGTRITRWHVAASSGARGASAAMLAEALAHANIRAPVVLFDGVAGAWQAACEQAAENDRIIVFGSFLTVAAVMNTAHDVV